MKALRTLVLCLSFQFPFLLFGQLELKLQVMPDGNSWGVYVRANGVSPSPNTYFASGQVTIVAPTGFEIQNLTNVAGMWSDPYGVDGPMENPDRKYMSFGLESGTPNIFTSSNPEHLLFTFENAGTECPDTLHFIDCNAPNSTDPFCPPNSYNSNSGCEISAIDFSPLGLNIYSLSAIYDHSAWNCSNAEPADPVFPDPDTNGLALSLKWIESATEWGVFAKPVGNISPSPSTYTASGQVTLVCPLDFEISSFTIVNGLWTNASGTIVSPQQNPTKKYISFGLAQGGIIPYQQGTETLLFKFKHASTVCPDSLYLIDCFTSLTTDPLCPHFNPPTGPTDDSNMFIISNVLDAVDFGNVGGTQFYNFVDIYDRTAWNCSNLTGVDPVQATYTESIELKLQLMPDESSWGVFAKVPPAVLTSDNVIVALTKVGIAAPIGFQFDNLSSQWGAWELKDRKDGPLGASDLTFLSFGQSFNNPSLAFEEEENLLFTFEKVGDCPDTLFVLDGSNASAGQFGSIFTLVAFDDSQIVNYDYCCNYDNSAWNCQGNFTGNSGSNVLNGNNVPSGKGKAVEPGFIILPNPAKGRVAIDIQQIHAEDLVLIQLNDLNGKLVLQQNQHGNGKSYLDISYLSEGIYFISLATNGKAVHRQKLVVLR